MQIHTNTKTYIHTHIHTLHTRTHTHNTYPHTQTHTNTHAHAHTQRHVHSVTHAHSGFFYYVPTESNALKLAVELGDILSLYQLYPVCITQKIGVKKELVLCENHDALEVGLIGVNGDTVLYGLAKIN
jgi:hypothetical protein